MFCPDITPVEGRYFIMSINPVSSYESQERAFIGSEGTEEATDEYRLHDPALHTNSDPNNVGHTQSVKSHLEQVLQDIAGTKIGYSQHRLYQDLTRTPSACMSVVNAQR